MSSIRSRPIATRVLDVREAHRAKRFERGERREKRPRSQARARAARTSSRSGRRVDLGLPIAPAVMAPTTSRPNDRSGRPVAARGALVVGERRARVLDEVRVRLWLAAQTVIEVRALL